MNCNYRFKIPPIAYRRMLTWYYIIMPQLQTHSKLEKIHNMEHSGHCDNAKNTFHSVHVHTSTLHAE